MIPSVLYVILTCAKYHKRRELQGCSWLKYIGEKDDFIYLSDKTDSFHHFSGDEKMIAYDTQEGYDYVPYKYAELLRNYSQFGKYDWIFFCDDDTFVFPKRLSWLLRYFDYKKSYMIGRLGNYEGWVSCSGGSGFAASSSLIIKTKEYVCSNEFNVLPNSDTSLAMWAKLAETDTIFVDRINQFQTQHLKHEDNSGVDIDTCISFHYCTEYDYKILSKHLKYNCND